MHKGHHRAYTSRDDMIAAGKYRKVGLELCFIRGRDYAHRYLSCMRAPAGRHVRR